MDPTLFASTKSAEVIVAEAFHRQRAELNWLRANCRVVFYPPDGRYPIEHAPGAKKDQWDAILGERKP